MTTRTPFRALLALGLALGLATGFLFAGNALAVDTGFMDTAKEALADADLQQISSPDMIAANIIKTALSYVGVVFLLVVIFAGFLWMTAAGNEERVSKAKKMVTGGVIGMILIFAAYAITEFVFQGIGAGLSAQEEGVSAGNECYDDVVAPDCGEDEYYDLDVCGCVPDGDGITSEEAAQLEIFNQ